MKNIFIAFIISLLTLKSIAQSTAVLPNRLDFAQRTYAQILAIPTPQKGSTCYDTDNNCLRIYDGSVWRATAATASAGFNDATGCCKGIMNAFALSGPSSLTYIVSFTQSASYNDELFEVGYCPGHPSGGLTYQLGTFPITVGTGSWGFISKYDANGSTLWVKGIGTASSANNVRVNAIKANSSGVYVIGTFDNTVTIATPTPTTLTSAGSSDIFLAKLDLAGNFVWAKQFGGGGYDDGVDLTFGDYDALYFTGYESGMTGAYCVPATTNTDVFVGKLSLTTGAVVVANAGVITNAPSATQDEIVKSILFYENKVLLIGGFNSTITPSSVATGCIGITGTTPLTGTGRGIYIIGYDINLVPVNTYKIAYSGDDAADYLNPLRATLESGFSGGTYAPKLKICANPVGTFPLGGKTISGGGIILTLNLNGASLPTINEVLTLQGADFTGFGDGYAVGRCTAASSSINSSATFGGAIGKNFLLSTNLEGNLNWVITSTNYVNLSGVTGSQNTTTVSKLCGKVFAAGNLGGGVQLCNSTLDPDIRRWGFFWLYNDCGGCCN